MRTNVGIAKADRGTTTVRKGNCQVFATPYKSKYLFPQTYYISSVPRWLSFPAYFSEFISTINPINQNYQISINPKTSSKTMYIMVNDQKIRLKIHSPAIMEEWNYILINPCTSRFISKIQSRIKEPFFPSDDNRIPLTLFLKLIPYHFHSFHLHPNLTNAPDKASVFHLHPPSPKPWKNHTNPSPTHLSDHPKQSPQKFHTFTPIHT